jgi:hypothetical protein
LRSVIANQQRATLEITSDGKVTWKQKKSNCPENSDQAAKQN